MTGAQNYLGLASPDGTSAKSSARLGAVVRSRLAGAGIGIAVAALTAFGMGPALADHLTGHDEVARGGIKALEQRVFDLEQTAFDTAGCVTGDVITFTGSVLECVTPGGVTSIRTVFTTSAVFTGDLATAGFGVDGLDGADNLCQEAAEAVGAIVPAGEYVAFLSTSTVAARDRLSPNNLGYVLANGTTVIATSKVDLLDGSILDPILLDETGINITPTPSPSGASPGNVWTGSTASGNLFDAQSTCSNWTSEGFDTEGRIGFPSEVNAEWVSGTNNLCGFTERLYCFQR